MIKRGKAQSGVEYVLLFAFLFIVLTPVFLYSLDTSTTSVRTTRSRELVETIAAAADNICSMGGGSTKAGVYIPYGVEYYVIDQRTIKIGIIIGETTGEAFARTLCNVTGDIPVTEGYKSIPITMLSNGTVYINGSGL